MVGTLQGGMIEVGGMDEETCIWLMSSETKKPFSISMKRNDPAHQIQNTYLVDGPPAYALL